MNIRKFIQIAAVGVWLFGWGTSSRAAWWFPNMPVETAQAKKDKGDKKPKKPKKPPTAPELPAGLLYGAGAGALALAYLLANRRAKSKK